MKWVCGSVWCHGVIIESDGQMKCPLCGAAMYRMSEENFRLLGSEGVQRLYEVGRDEDFNRNQGWSKT